MPAPVVDPANDNENTSEDVDTMEQLESGTHKIRSRSGSLVVPRRSFVLLLQKEGSENLDMKYEGKIFSYNTGKGVTERLEPTNEFKMDEKDHVDKESSCCSKSCGSCLDRCPLSCCNEKCCSRVCNKAIWCFPCLFLVKQSWPTLTVIALLLAVTLITMEFAADQNFCYFNPVVSIIPVPLLDPYSPGNFTATPKQKRRAHLTIGLLGDSMIGDAVEKNTLIRKIAAYLPYYDFNVTVHANNAVRMHNIRERLPRTNAREKVDGYIIMADSDITDISHAELNQQIQFGLLRNYTLNLRAIIASVQKQKKFIAIASPCGVLLESPYFGPPMSSRFHNKAEILNQYTKATQLAAESMGVPYIDIRTPFLEAIPLYRLAYKGCVTRDGEHANEFGTQIMAKKFAEVINVWFFNLVATKK